MANLMVTKCRIENYMMQTKTFYTKHHVQHKSVAEFPVKGSGLTPLIPLDKGWGAALALLVEYKC